VNGTVIPYFAFNDWPECPRAGALFDYGSVCNSSVRVRRLQIDSVNPRELDYQPLKIASDAGGSVINFRVKELYGWVAPIVTQHTYKTSFLSATDFNLMRIRYSEPEYVSKEEWLLLSFNYSNYRFKFQATYSNTTSVIPAFPDQTYELAPSQRFGT
jgi:hypothetical protein